MSSAKPKNKGTVVRAGELASAIEEFAPLATQEEWDNSGFSVGGANRIVKRGLIALNCTLEVVKEAVENNCDIIITHHPLIVHAPLMSILDGDPRSETAALAIKNGITIYSSHTPLDKAVGGLNTLMAQRMGIKSSKELVKGGFGAYGKLPQALTGKELIAEVKKAFNVKNIRCSKPLCTKISTIAVSSGGGQGSIADALNVGAQALITGDVTHHRFYTPDGFMVIDIGHHESEWSSAVLLETLIKRKFPNFPVQISKVDISPIYYF